MAVNRNYSSTMPATQLASGVSASATSIPVQSLVNNPTAPFTLVIDPGTVFEEVTTVTAVTGLSLTVVRGEDGTAALAHAAGAVARHMVTARDLREPQQHMADTSGVHGIGSGANVVGTSTTQSLTNKNISGAQNTITGLGTAAFNDGAVTSAKLASGIDSNKIGNLIDGASGGFHYSRLSTHGYGLGTMVTVRANDADGSAPSGDVWYVNTKGPSAALIGVTDQGVLSHVTVPQTLLGGPQAVSSFGSSPSGWSTNAAYASTLDTFGPFRELVLTTRTTKTLTFNSKGGLSNELMFTIDSGHRPKRVRTANMKYQATDGDIYGGAAQISSDGTITILSGAPNTTIRSSASASDWSVYIDCDYLSS